MIRGFIPAILICLFLLISSGAGASCGFSEANGSPVVVYGKEDAMKSVLNLGLAGQYPFIVFSHLQDRQSLEKLLSSGKGKIVLANGADEPGTEGMGWQSAHLFYGRVDGEEGGERFERTFSVEAGKYLIRAAAGPEGGDAANLKLDGKAIRIKNGCLEKRIALSGGRHTISMEGAGWFEAAVTKDAEEFDSPLPQVSFRKINPTRYIADVSGAKGPFTLVLGVSYNRNWKAFMRDNAGDHEPASALLSRWMDNRTNAGAHFLVNGYANGWVVEPGTADFQMVIEYEPQQYIEAGLAVSGAAFVISGIVLFLRRNKRG